MKKLLSVGLVLVFLLSVGIGNASAYTYLTDWFFYVDGGGGVAEVQIGEFFNTDSHAYITNTYSNATDFTFVETAHITSFSYFGVDHVTHPWPFIASGYLDAVFNGHGYGTVGGDVIFNGGDLEIFYSGTGNTLAKFNLNYGDIELLEGSAVPNGTVTAVLEATFLKEGVWFDASHNDLAATDPLNWVLGFSTTNASLVQDSMVWTSPSVQEFEIGGNGQFRLTVVPEPSTLLLLGSGLMGLGFYARRRKK